MLDNLFSWNVLLGIGVWMVLSVYFFKKVATEDSDYDIKEESCPTVLTVKERLVIINYFSATAIAGWYIIFYLLYKLMH